MEPCYVMHRIKLDIKGRPVYFILLQLVSSCLFDLKNNSYNLIHLQLGILSFEQLLSIKRIKSKVYLSVFYTFKKEMRNIHITYNSILQNFFFLNIVLCNMRFITSAMCHKNIPIEKYLCTNNRNKKL